MVGGGGEQRKVKTEASETTMVEEGRKCLGVQMSCYPKFVYISSL